MDEPKRTGAKGQRERVFAEATRSIAEVGPENTNPKCSMMLVSLAPKLHR